MQPDEVVIVAAKRTPLGNLLGSLSTLSAPELGAVAHRAALAHAGLPPTAIEEVISGCVLQAGIGQAPARQAAIRAGIPPEAGATTVNKMCGSGMKAIMLAHDAIVAGTAQVILAGGMESMSNAPYLLKKARAGYRLGHGELYDHIYLDGLEDAYDEGKSMGWFAEATAQKYNLTREQQDAFATQSLTKALAAQQRGAFLEEIAPVTVHGKKETIVVTADEGPDPAKMAKIPVLRPVFQADGTVTAANASSISDGAASVILMSRSQAHRLHVKPLARIVAHATHAQEPAWFTTAPVPAIQRVLAKAQWKHADLYEINEAFAVVTMVAMQALALDSSAVNVHGGACVLGHPIGASGARIVVTLLHALRQQQKKRGVAALCIGGGEATALAIEVM